MYVGQEDLNTFQGLGLSSDPLKSLSLLQANVHIGVLQYFVTEVCQEV